jgi:hypothetical protein
VDVDAIINKDRLTSKRDIGVAYGEFAPEYLYQSILNERYFIDFLGKYRYKGISLYKSVFMKEIMVEKSRIYRRSRPTLVTNISATASDVSRRMGPEAPKSQSPFGLLAEIIRTENIVERTVNQGSYGAQDWISIAGSWHKKLIEQSTSTATAGLVTTDLLSSQYDSSLKEDPVSTHSTEGKDDEASVTNTQHASSELNKASNSPAPDNGRKKRSYVILVRPDNTIAEIHQTEPKTSRDIEASNRALSETFLRLLNTYLSEERRNEGYDLVTATVESEASIIHDMPHLRGWSEARREIVAPSTEQKPSNSNTAD